MISYPDQSFFQVVHSTTAVIKVLAAERCDTKEKWNKEYIGGEKVCLEKRLKQFFVIVNFFTLAAVKLLTV